jgi:hypothetical protein
MPPPSSMFLCVSVLSSCRPWLGFSAYWSKNPTARLIQIQIQQIVFPVFLHYLTNSKNERGQGHPPTTRSTIGVMGIPDYFFGLPVGDDYLPRPPPRPSFSSSIHSPSPRRGKKVHTLTQKFLILFTFCSFPFPLLPFLNFSSVVRPPLHHHH